MIIVRRGALVGLWLVLCTGAVRYPDSDATMLLAGIGALTICVGLDWLLGGKRD